VYLAIKRSVPTPLKWIKGHSGVEGNKGADALAGDAARKVVADELDITVPVEYCITGTKTAAPTQALTERGIKDFMPKPGRRQTELNLGCTQAALEEFNGDLLTTRAIWEGT
jgi:hypothetical protein